jgi:acetyl-CoA carboxylase biotin carboxylase subunit
LTKPFQKILIANRGEIAVRIVAACREAGLRSVAVYSEADARSRHAREADEAVAIGPPPPRESYLRGHELIKVAHAVGAQAVHPGYGFLSENAEFAEAVRAAGLVFIGPPPEAIRKMGNKVGARTLMQLAEVPVVPGYHGGPGADFGEAAGTIGYPVLLKAAAGGGGRGMRVVHDPAELQTAIASAEREAAYAFGDSSIFLEKYLPGARHIEFQIFGDAHGHVLHLFERECSVQRRHQKVIEESPSPLLAQRPELRARMAAAAVAAARAVNYENAGTVEFIVDPDTLAFYFLEMNTRLQVEHPVTEAVTGLDLVRLQLQVAAGEPLPCAQAQVTQRGHAVECRVYAEDPADHFYPSTGPLLVVREPRGPGLRVDSGFEAGDEVTPFYDALLAKVIAYGAGRAEALQKMDAALAQFAVLGVATNISFLRALLAHPDFQNGTATTRFIEERFADWGGPDGVVPPEAFAAAAALDLLAPAASGRGGADPAPGGEPDSPWSRGDSFRMGGG